MAKFFFWASIAALLYTYLGYPVCIWLLANLRNRKVSKAAITPTVSVVVACHNEASNIEARIKNLAESDYPKDRLEIIVASDGSTDDTVEAARRAASKARQCVTLIVLAYPKRLGKAAALNLGVRHATGDVIVLTDARQRFDPCAIKEMVANFADPKVGAVSGELLLGSNCSSIGKSIGLYWKYEKWIRKSESRFDSTIGATGAIYAVRRQLWPTIPPTTILDDVYVPMRVALGGHRVVFEERAIAYDWIGSASREFSRKVRTLTGNYQLCQLMPSLLLPAHRLFVQFYSHKLLRLLAPIFFLVILLANLAVVAQQPEALFYQASLMAQALFYTAVVIGGRWGLRVPLVGLAYGFSVMNAAALVGLFCFLRGKRDVWVRGE
jgi:biofilm PGA synthesis N-glycosyltransferase PgaC